MPFCGGSSSTNVFNRRPLQRKLVVLGDGAAGKTSLLNVFCRGFFTHTYEPTVFENYVHELHVDDHWIELSLWDTAGQEEFDRLRSLSYAETHIIMLCFAVDNPISLENVESKVSINWHSLVLVACKCDLREDEETIQRLGRQGKRIIVYEEGLAVARRINASRYLECSAKHNRGVTEVFTEAARVAIGARAKGSEGYGASKKDGCIIM
ncbi:Rho GTPase [Serendipita sp. 411]|nr:Rho GTPase [Serendipita sp. 411]KAG8869559.1 Rho GTPase [Serendipita sp. 405]